MPATTKGTGLNLGFMQLGGYHTNGSSNSSHGLYTFRTPPTPRILQHYQMTCMELAIACDILTGGALAPASDLLTKTMFMRAAFAHYYHRTALLTYQDVGITYTG